ncbi:MAG: hypothetical protein WKF83_09810 [Nocardioidaceae bacterium]
MAHLDPVVDHLRLLASVCKQDDEVDPEFGESDTAVRRLDAADVAKAIAVDHHHKMVP